MYKQNEETRKTLEKQRKTREQHDTGNIRKKERKKGQRDLVENAGETSGKYDRIEDKKDSTEKTTKCKTIEKAKQY